MSILKVQVQRVRIVSHKTFEEIVQVLLSTIGHPEINAFHKALTEASTISELERVVHEAIGSSELMEFSRFDSGEVLRKEQGGQGPKILRFLIGNPLIMKEMTKHVPDAAAYAPVTILVDERIDGVHLTYDTMASLLAPYGNQAALSVARDLDAKVENLMETAAH